MRHPMRHLFLPIGIQLCRRAYAEAGFGKWKPRFCNGLFGWTIYLLNLLEQLKTGTSHLHRALESELDLLRPGFRISEYMELLERFYGFYVVWEPEVDRRLCQISGLDLQRRAKTPLLASDLTSLGYDSIRLSRLARCKDVPTYHSPEMLLGGLYVTEGSTLGGLFLAQHFRKSLGLRPGAGVSFFSSYEGEVGSMWNRFRSLLTETVAPEKESHVVRGAILTFECMHSWLCSERAVLA